LLPDEFLSVAKTLSTQTAPSGEPRYRTITGRCYYAAYLATRDAICVRYGFPPDSYLKHELVCNTLAAVDTDPDVRKLGNLLSTLKLSRRHADYTLKKALDETISDDALVDAAAAIALVDAVKDRLPRIEPAAR